MATPTSMETGDLTSNQRGNAGSLSSNSNETHTESTKNAQNTGEVNLPKNAEVQNPDTETVEKHTVSKNVTNGTPKTLYSGSSTTEGETDSNVPQDSLQNNPDTTASISTVTTTNEVTPVRDIETTSNEKHSDSTKNAQNTGEVSLPKNTEVQNPDTEIAEKQTVSTNVTDGTPKTLYSGSSTTEGETDSNVPQDSLQNNPDTTASISTVTTKNEVTSVRDIETTLESSVNVASDKHETNNTVNDGHALDTSEVHKVIIGQCKMDKLPPLPKKIVRIFVSSTFTDTKEERNALMQNVYPKLADYCRERHGLEFQIVDMRWGVPEQASDNHSTTDLCLHEIHKCQEVSVGPNFVAIIGNKYGYRPIPSTIDKPVFDTLQEESELLTEVAEDWKVVADWYKKDENAIPVTYVLQPISSKILHYSSGTAEEREVGWKEWNSVNQTIQRVLRATANSACAKNKISDIEKQRFHISVTENEVTEGILQDKAKPHEACFCIIRNITDIEQHISESKGPRFTDLSTKDTLDSEAIAYLKELKEAKIKSKLPDSNLTKVDIEWSYSGANVSLEEIKDMKIPTAKELEVYKHKEYLDQICTGFFSRISKMIQQGSSKQKQIYDGLTVEVLQHWYLAKLRCEIFEGREDVLEEVKTFLTTQHANSPLVIYGNSGCGKTSVMAKVKENIVQNSFGLPTQPFVISRFLGTTSLTSNLHQLLVSICQQLAIMYETTWSEPEKQRELIKSFHAMLNFASREKPLILLIDSVDQLLPTYNAFKMQWLPSEMPENVKVIVSTIQEGYPILANCEIRYASTDLNKIQVQPLGEQLGLRVIKKWLEKASRTMTTQQQSVIVAALSKCSLPLYARIAFDQIVKWKSYDLPSIDKIETTVKGAINKLFQSIEDKFGKTVVKHCLAFLTASRNGLSETELEHILSMDDMLLNTVFKFWNPPIRRIPPLIWTRIRSDVNNYIVERSADDTLVLYWYHRQFIQTTKQRYLSEPDFQKHIHQHLAEFFSGKWSQGREKPFEYSDSQVKRFGLAKAQSAADRKLPAQPYRTQSSQLGEAQVWYNKRKMSELPFHLVKCRNYEDMKKLVFFNFEWIENKVKSTSVQQMLEEFEVFIQSDKTIQKDIEMKLLFVNLQLIRPFLITFPESLSYELQGRLASNTGVHENMTYLLKQCDAIGSKHCPFVPLITCFETADLGLSQNFNFRSTEPWHTGGTFSCSNNFQTAFIIDYDENGLPMLQLWDITSGEKISQVSITKPRTNESMFFSDVYVQMRVVKGGKQVLVFGLIQDNASYMKKIKKDAGFVDVINVDTGEVVATYDCFTYHEEFVSPLLYITDNILCAKNGWKRSVINFTTGNIQSFNKVTHLSADEQLFIFIGKDKLSLRTFESKELVADFDVTVNQKTITANEDFTVVVMIGTDTHDISVFDLWTKKDNLKPKKQFTQVLKPKHVFKLDARTKGLVDAVFKPVIRPITEGQELDVFITTKVHLDIAPDKHHLLVTFIGVKWMAFMWGMNIYKYNARFIGEITPNFMKLSSKYPQFNFDGSMVVYTNTQKQVIVVDSDTAEKINDYTLQEPIKDFCMSKVDNRIAVMQQKGIVILSVSDIAKRHSHEAAKTKRAQRIRMTDSDTSKGLAKPEVVFEREICGNEIHRELVCQNVDGKVMIEEVSDLAESVDTDRISSARSKREHALEKHVTPDGTKTVHYHTRVQVIDTKTDDIKYTPKKGDYVLRVQQEKGITSNATVPIQGLESANPRHSVMDLLQGDRITNESNKIKLRVEKDLSDRYKIMTVPSVLTIYTTEELELRRLHRVNVYNETVLTVSNQYIITGKSTKNGHFVNIYSMAEGKLLATHSIGAVCDCAEFSADEVQLFVVDRNFTVRMLLGPTFTATEQRISIVLAEKSAAFVVKSIDTFSDDRNSVLVRYGPEGPDAFVRSRYIHLNFISKAQSPEMKVTQGFEDLTPDGTLGIDANLNLYDLQKGVLVRKVPYIRSKDNQDETKMLENIVSRRMRYVDASASQLYVRITYDKKYIVFTDKVDSSLHLVSMQGSAIKRKVSCSSHMSDLTNFDLRCNGRLVVLQSKQNSMYIAIVESTEQELVHSNEFDRAVSISKQLHGNSKTTQPDKQSVYIKRSLLLSNVGKATSEDNFVSRKQARRRNIAQTIPTALIIDESFLCVDEFKPRLFSDNLDTDVLTVRNAEDALEKLGNVTSRVDTIVINLGTNDVPQWDSVPCFIKISAVVDMARQKTGLTVISLAPARSDNMEYNERTRKVNEKLEAFYKATCKADSHVHICKNTNLTLDDKPNPRFISDGMHLSFLGKKRMVLNMKAVIGPHLKKHCI